MARASSAGRDAALEELFRSPPATFTRTRDALARRLKEEGDAEAALDLKKLRRPPVVAYVLNQLSRAHADDVAELVDVGRELARAQRKALRGETTTGLREAIARQRDVVSALTSKTVSLMKELDVPAKAHLDEIASALQAALVDPSIGEQLEEGRLEEIPAPAAGFGEERTPRTRTRTRTQTPTRTRTQTRTQTQTAKRERARELAEARAEKKALALAKASDASTALARAADDAAERAAARLAEARDLEKRAKEAMADATRLAVAAKRAQTAAARAAKRTKSLRRT